MKRQPSGETGAHATNINKYIDFYQLNDYFDYFNFYQIVALG